MADIVLARDTGTRRLDGAVRSKVYDFLDQLRADETSATAEYLERIDNASDHRVRLGRIDIQHSAIVFRVDPAKGNVTYIFIGAWQHDEARTFAQRSILRVNPVSGVLECVLDGNGGRAKASPLPDRDDADSATTPQSPIPILIDYGHSVGALVDRLGLDREIAERALAAADHAALADIAETAGTEAGSWQRDVLLDLAAGDKIDDIRERYHLGTGPSDRALDEERRIVAALDHPTSKMHFAYIGDDTHELRRVIEEGDFTAWRTFLHPDQRRYAEQHYNGAFRLSGGAGTGKTVVLMHRAHRLWKRNPNARIVLTTFNTGLARVLEQNLRTLDPNVAVASALGEPGIYVRSIDKLAHDVINSPDHLDTAAQAVLGTRTSSALRTRADDRRIHDAWSAASTSTGLKTDPDPQIGSAEFLGSEYINVFLARRVRRKDDYLRIPRRGRKVRLTRAQRIRVWDTVEEFRDICRRMRVVSYPEALAVAAECLRVRAEKSAVRIADHVLVDEAQDLHAAHWAFLRAMTDEGPNDLFVAEDPHQRIFTEPLRLSDLSINIVGRSRRLTLNYRTTEQTLRFAVKILEDGTYLDLEGEQDSISGYRSARIGPPPKLLTPPASQELPTIADQLQDWLAAGHTPNTLAILTRSRGERRSVAKYLSRIGINAAEYEDHPVGADCVQVLTMHRAKGMEFSRVILTGVGPDFMAGLGKEAPGQSANTDALLRERSLLYVSASRARDELVVIQGVGKPGTAAR
ncbi:AAA family ATPase [Nocardia cyriacigeorgica]|uniref:DNA 3'-5' helicase n=1 Tax=Nocardia cyriacigeorgica TaxID=135487 RepID=A0ABX0CVJ0_9NOCA|nr:3'-5' exonuclease [Nocardia cyriacigeorgica]NEW58671.1 AAA family ATPase [Nocardia cyriacigeorgica]